MFRSVSLPDGITGKLFLHSLPGRYEPYQEAAREIEKRRIDEVVCLATLEEIRLKSPQYEKAGFLDNQFWQQRMFPIPNFGAPEDRDGFLHLVRDLSRSLISGKRLLVHCGGGVGRTGMLAVGLLIALGMDAEQAGQAVISADSHPETAVQDRLLEWLALQFDHAG